MPRSRSGRHHRPLAFMVLAVSAAALTPPPATAAFAGTVSRASASVRIQGVDKKLYEVTAKLQLVEAAGASPSYSFAIGVAKCSTFSCGAAKWYKVPTTSASIASDLTSATVSAKFQGLPLKLTWAGGGSGPNLALGVNLTGTGVLVADPAGGRAGMSGQLLGVTCGGEGSLERFIGADATDPAPLEGSPSPNRTDRAFAKSGKRVPTCVRG